MKQRKNKITVWLSVLLLAMLYQLKAADGMESNSDNTVDQADQQIKYVGKTLLPLNADPERIVIGQQRLRVPATDFASEAALPKKWPDKTEENAVKLNRSLEGRKKMEDSLGFWHAFIASLSVIIVSELGDKTWFIAVILAMRHSRLTVFAGAVIALALMTVLSVGLGWATQIIPRKFTYYISTALFALFGIRMLMEGWKKSPNEGQEEYEEAQAEVQEKEMQLAKDMEGRRDADLEAAVVYDAQRRYSVILTFVSKIFLEAFTLTFFAEWGDRSQLTTIILAAREDVVGVTVGGILGHSICTGIAVLGGRLVAQQISVRTVTLVGGIVFIVFALSALILNPDGN